MSWGGSSGHPGCAGSSTGPLACLLHRNVGLGCQAWEGSGQVVVLKMGVLVQNRLGSTELGALTQRTASHLFESFSLRKHRPASPTSKHAIPAFNEGTARPKTTHVKWRLYGVIKILHLLAFGSIRLSLLCSEYALTTRLQTQEWRGPQSDPRISKSENMTVPSF